MSLQGQVQSVCFRLLLSPRIFFLLKGGSKGDQAAFPALIFCTGILSPGQCTQWRIGRNEMLSSARAVVRGGGREGAGRLR